jgi:hypothetical protein
VIGASHGGRSRSGRKPSVPLSATNSTPYERNLNVPTVKPSPKEEKKVTKHDPHEFQNNFISGGVVDHSGKTIPAATVYRQLAAPFADDVIERTKALQTRKAYDTTGIKYQAVVDRFNDVVTPWGWGYKVVSEEVLIAYRSSSGKDMLECIIDIEIDVLGKKAVHTGNHTAAAKGDARKGAITNALKKCAAMFGVGRQVYLGSLDDDNEPVSEKKAKGEKSVPEATPPEKIVVTEDAILGDCPVGKSTKGKKWLDLPSATLEMFGQTKGYPVEQAIAAEILARRGNRDRRSKVTGGFYDKAKATKEWARITANAKVSTEDMAIPSVMGSLLIDELEKSNDGMKL